MDNLNIHRLSSLYSAFPPEEARCLAWRFRVHLTPVHARWLNMAELEISALERQCLDRRIGDMEVLAREVAAWVRERNERQVQVHWRFTSQDARQKMEREYRQIKS